MLTLTRKLGQVLRIAPLPSLDPATPVGELFRMGPIEVMVMRIEGNHVRLGIKAPASLLIVRNELVGEKEQDIGRKRRKFLADEDDRP